MQCDRCKRLCQHAITNRIKGQGPKDADIVFVGEAPGREEDEVGKPFVGASGKYLDKYVFKPLNIDRRRVRITNAVRCRPPNNKTPNIGEIRNCQSYLARELQAIAPKAVVTFGNVPLNAVLPIKRTRSEEKEKPTQGVSGITRWRGKKIWHPIYNCWIIPTWHPAAAMRTARMGFLYQEDQMIADVSVAIQAVSEKPVLQEYPTILSVLDDEKRALRVLQHIMKAPVYAVDLETEGFDAKKDAIIGICLASEKSRGFYIHWNVLRASAACLKLLQQLLLREDRLRIMHNGAFDEKFLYFNGLKVGVYHDTMLAASLVDENFFKSLKDLTWRYLHIGGYDAALDDYKREHRIKKFSQIPFELLSVYGGMDAVATLQLYHVLVSLMRQEKVLQHFVERVMPERRVLTQIEIGGFAVDLEYSTKLLNTTNKMITYMEKRIYQYAGEAFNINSPKQKATILFEKLKLPVLKRTKTGGPCTDKTVMEELSKKKNKGGKVADLIRQRSKVTKNQGTFIKAVLSNVWDDSRIHTRYNMAGTVTGRCSCSNPGIHNVPRDRAIRTQYRPDPGHLLLVTDIKSAELRCLAFYSKEPTLIRAFNENRDVHNETYNIMFGKKSSYVPTDDERFISKAINFGLIYGRGPKSLAETLGVSVDEAMHLISQYFKKLPKAEKFLKDTVSFAKKYGYVVSLFGRRRHLPDIQTDNPEMVARASRQAKNSIIQGTAADITFLVMRRIYDRMQEAIMTDSRIVHTVHDSILITAPEARIENLKYIVSESFATPIPKFDVKLEIDTDIESKWGEHKEQSGLIDLYKQLRGKEEKKA